MLPPHKGMLPRHASHAEGACEAWEGAGGGMHGAGLTGVELPARVERHTSRPGVVKSEIGEDPLDARGDAVSLLRDLGLIKQP